jgi:hypothetical protein
MGMGLSAKNGEEALRFTKYYDIRRRKFGTDFGR